MIYLAPEAWNPKKWTLTSVVLLIQLQPLEHDMSAFSYHHMHSQVLELLAAHLVASLDTFASKVDLSRPQPTTPHPAHSMTLDYSCAHHLYHNFFQTFHIMVSVTMPKLNLCSSQNVSDRCLILSQS